MDVAVGSGDVVSVDGNRAVFRPHGYLHNPTNDQFCFETWQGSHGSKLSREKGEVSEEQRRDDSAILRITIFVAPEDVSCRLHEMHGVASKHHESSRSVQENDGPSGHQARLHSCIREENNCFGGTS